MTTTIDTSLEERMRALGRISDAPAGVQVALMEMAQYIERMEVHQAWLERELLALRGEHVRPEHFPTRVEELVDDRSGVRMPR